MSSIVGLPQPDFAGITKALSKGDVQTLSSYLNETVELAVGDEEDIYDKAEAISVIKNFFKSHPPKSFSEVHKGTSKGNDSQYCIGNLIAGGKTYRVYIYLKSTSDKYLIQELRIDLE